MILTVEKKFDWQEDLEIFEDLETFGNKGTILCGISNSYRVHLKLSWKGKLRKLFRIKKTV